jgi:hypothetical protein
MCIQWLQGQPVRRWSVRELNEKVEVVQQLKPFIKGATYNAKTGSKGKHGAGIWGKGVR